MLGGPSLPSTTPLFTHFPIHLHPPPLAFTLSPCHLFLCDRLDLAQICLGPGPGAEEPLRAGSLTCLSALSYAHSPIYDLLCATHTLRSFFVREEVYQPGEIPCQLFLGNFVFPLLCFHFSFLFPDLSSSRLLSSPFLIHSRPLNCITTSIKRLGFFHAQFITKSACIHPHGRRPRAENTKCTKHKLTNINLIEPTFKMVSRAALVALVAAASVNAQFPANFPACGVRI